MLKGCKILTGFCVICATLYGGAYGAASVRGGATSRAGSIRTLGAGTTASVKTMTSRTQPTTTAANANTESTESVGGMRMSHATGLGGSKLPGKISGTTTSTSGDNQNVAELRQAIEQLRNDYDALGEQYNNLLGDVSNVSDTAQVAHETATNNTNTLTVVRSDLSVAKSDIEDLKATGGFDEERVQEALDTTLAQRNYATRGELAATDAVARGAVQVADLPQTLNALNIADKDYVASRTQGVVNDSLNITLENYYTKGQVNAAIDIAKMGMVDKNYVDNQIDGLAAKTYVDNRVASIQTGVSEGAVQGIINNSIDTRLENYYTKGDIDNAIGDAIDVAKDGMVDRDYVDNQVRDLASTEYVNEKVAEIESGVDAGTLYNILETRGYKTGTEVQGIVNDSINNTVANYYTKSQVDNAINVAKNGMADRNYVDNQIDGLAPKNWVNTVVDAKVNALPLGLDQNAVKAVVEGYGYKDEAGVQEMINASGHVKTSELPDLIKQWAPGAEIQYADGKLYFVDKDGNDRVVDIRGIDGQDGAQVEIRQNDGWIQWHYEGDTEWNNLVAMSDLKGADGESVKLDVQSMNGYKNALVYSKENESNWQFLYSLDDIKGADGCGIKVETNDYVSGGALLGKIVKLLRDCPGQIGDGDILTQFTVLNGVDGTVTEEQIVAALESNPVFMQLKSKVNNLSDGLDNTNDLLSELSDKVDNNTTGLSATNTLANNAWDKVKDLDAGITAKMYTDSKVGDLGFDLLTHSNYASVAAKLGAIDDTKTVAEYINAQISKINTSIQVERGDDGVTYICKTGNNCTTNPNPYTGDWARISVDVSGYLTRAEADDAFAPIGIVGAVTTAQDAASQAQTQASQAWGKLSGLGGDTVKGYVDNTIDGRVGSLGINPLTGVSYTVAGKLGFGQGTATQTVKEYIDEKFRSVNTEIMIADGPDGLMYICRKGNTCTTTAGPSNSHEWAAVSVDMSDYLKESDAEREFATITALNGVQATANEAKTAANTAQTSATQAQNVANSAQSTANDAWGKLESLGSKTVTEYVDEQVNSTGSTIRVETGSDGYTYICRTGTCLDSPSSSSPYWARIELNIPSEYLTETEGNALYAPKAEYALKSYVDGNIGALGGSFTNVGTKIGLNDYQYGNTTVKEYVDNKVSNISTTIQVQTSSVDGFTYICKRGSGCTGEPSADPSQWAKVNVDLSSINTILNGFGGNNQPANVKNYIDTSIGSLGYSTNEWGQQTPYSVLTYLQANYVPRTKLGDSIAGNANKTVEQYISDKIGSLGMYWDSSSYQNVPYTSVKQYVDDKFALKTSIGDLGSNGSANYTVAQKIGLNTDDTKNTTVKTYVDNRVGSLGKTDGSTYATSVAAKLGNSIINADQTVADYIQSKIDGISRDIQVEQVGNDTYICKTGNNCSTPVLDYYPAQWAKITIDVSGYLTEETANGLYAEKSVQTAVEDSSTGLSATYTLASGANTTANNAWDKVKGLNEVSGLSDKTVEGYVDYRLGEISGTVKAYVDNKVESGGVQVSTFGNKTYICSNNCTTTPPCSYPGQCGWQELDIDVSSKAEQSDMTAVQNILAGFGTGTGNWATVKTYIGDMGNYKDSYSNDVNYTVETKIGLNTDDTKNKSVTQYIADKLGFTGADANKTVAQYIAEHAASGGVTVRTVTNNGVSETYICSENCETDPPCKVNDTPDTCGWQKLEVDLRQYLKSSDAASTYLPRTNLKLVRDGADIRLKRVVGDDVTDYGIVAGVQDLMCRSYRTETVEPGVDGCPASGSACYKMICNTNGND